MFDHQLQLLLCLLAQSIKEQCSREEILKDFAKSYKLNLNEITQIAEKKYPLSELKTYLKLSQQQPIANNITVPVSKEEVKEEVKETPMEESVIDLEGLF